MRRSFERSEADKGVEQFVDSLLKYGLYGLLIFCLISSLGFDTTSVAALLASSGVAIGLALQEVFPILRGADPSVKAICGRGLYC